MHSGGRVGGVGMLGVLNATTGGIIAPGHSIGTLNATAVNFGTGSFYDVEVDATGASDRILATGAATLTGGTVRVSASPDYRLGSAYTILSAAGGVSGSFAGATTNLAFVTPVLSYDASNAFLTLTQGANFVSAARTPNQLAVAPVIDGLGTGNALHNGMLLLTADEARRAFDALSGEGHGGLSSSFIEDAADLRQAALERARLGSARPSLALGYAGTPELVEPDEPISFWASAMGNRSMLAGDGNAADTLAGSGGLALGADGVAGDWRIGALLYAGGTGHAVPARDFTATSADVGFGVYAGTHWGDTALGLGLTYARHGVSSRRDVVFGGFADTLTADYAAGTGQAFAELSHRFDLGAVGLTPFGELAYVLNSHDGFAERGGAAALTVSPGAQQAAFTTIGMRADSAVLTGAGMPVTVQAGLGWRHAFAEAADVTGAVAGGSAHTVTGTPVVGDALVLDAGIAADLSPTTALGLSYDARLGAGGQTHGVRATLSGAF